MSLLLFFAAFSYILTHFSHPFVFSILNDIECYSLMSAIITLFSGALYLCNVSDYIKAISFSAIVLVNLCFALCWALNLFSIVFETNLTKLQQIFPFFTYALVAFIMTFQKTERSWNIFVYLSNIKKNYIRIRKEIIETYETQNLSQKKKKLEPKPEHSKKITKTYFV